MEILARYQLLLLLKLMISKVTMNGHSKNHFVDGKYLQILSKHIHQLRMIHAVNRTNKRKMIHILVQIQIQADAMYVPTSPAAEFAVVAEIMVDHKVFLECGFSKIVDMI